MYEPVIGLEIHVELSTNTKMFCGCENRFGASPNTLICPVCLGLPGALPLPNAKAVTSAVKLGLALGMTIAPRLSFDRKNYFYPDLPKGYQISQKEDLLAQGGHLKVGEREIRIHHLHLEEDAGKLLHYGGEAGVDLNRAGVPLVEIVSEPDLRSAEEARAYMEEMRRVIQHLGISEVRMEEGNLRADVNVSLRRIGDVRLGTRAEVKNMNSFRAVERAILYEILRQTAELEAGRPIIQETRGFHDASGETYSQRRKEEADDYRYFPEPDLLPVPLKADWVKEVGASLPPLPETLRAQFASMGLGPDERELLVETPKRAHLLLEAVAQGAPTKQASNWILGDILRVERESGISLEKTPFTASHLVALLDLVQKSEITGPAAKTVLETVYRTGEAPADVVKRDNLGAVSDASGLDPEIEAVFSAHPKAVEELAMGSEKPLFFLVGQLMRRTAGRADPKVAAEMMREKAQTWKPPS